MCIVYVSEVGQTKKYGLEPTLLLICRNVHELKDILKTKKILVICRINIR